MSLPTRTMLAVAGALVAVSSALGALGFRSDQHPTSPAASCGSVLLPVDTWSDCVRDRNSMAGPVAILALIALLLAVAVAVASWRRGDTRTVAPRSARTVAVVITLLAVAGSAAVLVSPAGRSRCGATLTHLTTHPSDSFGNADGDCVDSYQERWLMAGIGAVIAAAAATLARTQRWLVTGVAATLTASVVILGVTAIGWLWLAARGGR